MRTRTAKVFVNGSSQAVHLPAEFRFDVDDVFVEKVGEQVILTPKRSGSVPNRCIADSASLVATNSPFRRLSPRS